MNIIVIISIFMPVTIGLVEMFAKGLAEQITIKHCRILENLAASGYPETAFCLSEQHAKREANAHEFMWLERAAAMGHREAAQRLRKRSS